MGLTALAGPSRALPQVFPVAVSDSDSVAVSAKKEESAEKKKDDKKKPSEYETLMKKKGTVLPGVMTTRHIEGKWYFEVPDTLLGRLFLVVTRFTGVPQDFGKFSGEEVSRSAVYFERRDDKSLILRSYVLSQLADSTDRIAKTLRQSTVDPIVASFHIIGRDSTKTYSLVEVTSLFKKDNNLTGVPSAQKTRYKLQALADDRTFIDTMKVFPTNIEVITTRTYGAQPTRAEASQTGSVTLGLNTSIVLLPAVPMRPRFWDSRVGYFTDRVTIFSDEQQKSQHEQMAARYRLVPKNVRKYMRGELTEPVKPIVYYIDPATPKQWVPYLIQGINDWNEAFEAAGFKNAIVGREWPNDPTMSVDDARFSVLRYLPSETENAYGPRIVDPRSGEILEAHVCWYHNVMNLVKKWYMVQCGAVDKRARTMKFDEKLMGQLIRFVSSHEIGHTLGLRHNMGASSATPVEKLRDKKWVEEHGHTVSIMDYARFNYVAQPEDGISERGLFPRINDYDKWAIKWGYQYRPDFDDEYKELEGLKKETTIVLRDNPRLWFGGEGRNGDPRAQTEDLGDDAVAASDYGVKNLQRVLKSLPEWTRQENDDYTDLNEMYKAVRDQFQRYTGHVLTNIDGHYVNNLPGREPVEPVPAAKMKKAIGWLDRQLFDAPMWMYPDNLVFKTDMSVFGDITRRYTSVLTRALSATTLNRIYNTSLLRADAYKLDAYLSDLAAAVWKEAKNGTNQNAMREECRRALQRIYLDKLNELINPTEPKQPAATTTQPQPSTPSTSGAAVLPQGSAVLFAIKHLDIIEAFARKQLGKCASGSVEALHYDDVLQRIKLIRERRTTVK